MSITTALNNAIGGLGATARQIGVASDNIANALTKGYAARAVTLAPLPQGGVTVTGVARATDIQATALRRGADSEAAAASTQSGAVDQLATAFGEVGDGDTLLTRLTAFQQALGTLAETPEQEPLQVSAANAAVDLADAFNSASATAQQVRQDADGQIRGLVSTVNGDATAIVALNRQIQIAMSAGRDTSGLEDQRQSLVDEINAAMPVRAFDTPDGGLELRTTQGLLLVGTTAHPLSLTLLDGTPAGATGVAPQSTYLGGQLAGLSIDGIDVTPGGGGSQQIDSGALAGFFSVRDTLVPNFQSQIDGLAQSLVDRLTPTAGQPGIFVDTGTASAGTTGLAGRIAINPVLDPSTGEVWRFRDGLSATAPSADTSSDTFVRTLVDALSGGAGGSLLQSMADAQQTISTTRVDLDAVTTRTTSAQQTLAANESTATGVNTDSELESLISIEHAYAANAQVITTAANMLDALLKATQP